MTDSERIRALEIRVENLISTVEKISEKLDDLLTIKYKGVDRKSVV